MLSNVRPRVRRKFPNFSFSRVSDMFGFRSPEIFRKKTEFSNSRNFRVKVRKKVRNSSSVKNSVIIQKFWKNDVKFEVLGQKTLFFGQKVWKSSEKSSEKVRKFRKKFGNFGNWFFRMFGNFENSKLSENYKKMTFNSNFGNYEIFVPTRKPTRKFG